MGEEKPAAAKWGCDEGIIEGATVTFPLILREGDEKEELLEPVLGVSCGYGYNLSTNYCNLKHELHARLYIWNVNLQFSVVYHCLVDSTFYTLRHCQLASPRSPMLSHASMIDR
jgi:hypothetical protein